MSGSQKPKHTQPSISSYFSQSQRSPRSKTTPSKRLTSPIDLTLDSDDDAHPPPTKRQKTTREPLSSLKLSVTPRKTPQPAPKSTGQAQQWRFDPESPTRTPHTFKAGEKRRIQERAKKILLGNDNVFRMKKQSKDATPSSDIEGGLGDSEPPPEEDEDEGDKKFSELMSMFASSSGSKAGKGGTLL